MLGREESGRANLLGCSTEMLHWAGRKKKEAAAAASNYSPE